MPELNGLVNTKKPSGGTTVITVNIPSAIMDDIEAIKKRTEKTRHNIACRCLEYSLPLVKVEDPAPTPAAPLIITRILPRNIKLSLKVNRSIAEKVDSIAAESGRTRSEIISMCLNYALRKVENHWPLLVDQESGLIIGTPGAGRDFHTIDIPLTAADGRP